MYNSYVYQSSNYRNDSGQSWMGYSNSSGVATINNGRWISMRDPGEVGNVRAEVLLKSDQEVYSDGKGGYVLFKPPNTQPTFDLTNRSEDQIINSNGKIQISEVVTDPDSDLLKIKATIGGSTKQVDIQGPANKVNFTLIWEGKDLIEGSYEDFLITVLDRTESISKNYWGKVTVDKTNPKLHVKIER